MKRPRKNKGLAIFIGIVLIICIIITFIILAGMVTQTMRRNLLWFGTEMSDPNQEIALSNVYITECNSGSITFLYERELYTLRGKLEEPYQGVADIIIKNQKIQKIFLKQDAVEGTLLSYTDGQIEVDGYGLLPCEEDLKVYMDYGNTIKEISMSDLVVGSSRLQYIAANDRICAVIQKERTDFENIHVLLKNGNSLFYPELYITGNGNWSLDSKEQKKGESVDIVQYMDQNSLQAAMVSCADGLLYRTDKNGKTISSGYEGTFYIKRASDGFVLINELPIEDYIRYVLPSEMPDTFSEEALKAQAVCARTFAYSQMKNSTYAAYGANLDDSTAYQVYNATGTKEAADQAVIDTAGEVIACNGELITCYYFSTSPGITSDMEVWQAEPLEYIQAQNTVFDDCGDLSSEEAFLDFICRCPDAYDSGSPFYRWTAEIDLTGAEDASYGNLKSFSVSKRNSSGYIIGLTATYENGSRLIENENEIRTLLGPYMTKLTLSDGSTRTDFSMLPSACFAITESNKGVMTLTGGGFGHGIGMSQYGADAMGSDGKDYLEIISCYYNGVEVCQVTEL